ncbi:phosphotriesterase-related protein [Roseibacterium sp. SDUM158017]|uniref:phosphotriesterase family protein n=1 Tax=Roseicyclus salinarum TaxID=3036773 RepID=UPI0024157F49|nr:phosphotriesterase-related protein [Roseibacterium sp. SDUM158017]MDG4647494.1 phosphotriesterase-related protein [Roseibacterium sp. SDUM158017]
MHRTPSPTVSAVAGPVARDSLGVTLMHEHILNDCTCWWRGRDPDFVSPIRDLPVSASILSRLKHDPFACRDNCALNDESLAVAELLQFAEEGGRTVVDPTCRGIGRSPEALRRISKATGLNIVMGSGYYLQSSHPAGLAAMTAEDVARELVAEHREGVGPEAVPIGLIGEIGVSADFTPEERKSLRGASMAALETGLPLMIHLPGWERLAHEVLDTVAGEGQPLDRVILCHMNPSWDDGDYQRALADRGAFLEYDMIGMDYWYDDQQVQCPSDEDCARAIAALVRDGYRDRLLLSQDVFVKMMLTPFGGNGYAHVQRHFLPRLLRLGLGEGDLERLMVANPAAALCAYTTPETTP